MPPNKAAPLKVNINIPPKKSTTLNTNTYMPPKKSAPNMPPKKNDGNTGPEPIWNPPGSTYVYKVVSDDPKDIAKAEREAWEAKKKADDKHRLIKDEDFFQNAPF